MAASAAERGSPGPWHPTAPGAGRGSPTRCACSRGTPPWDLPPRTGGERRGIRHLIGREDAGREEARAHRFLTRQHAAGVDEVEGRVDAEALGEERMTAGSRASREGGERRGDLRGVGDVHDVGRDEQAEPDAQARAWATRTSGPGRPPSGGAGASMCRRGSRRRRRVAGSTPAMSRPAQNDGPFSAQQHSSGSVGLRPS